MLYESLAPKSVLTYNTHMLLGLYKCSFDWSFTWFTIQREKWERERQDEHTKGIILVRRVIRIAICIPTHSRCHVLHGQGNERKAIRLNHFRTRKLLPRPLLTHVPRTWPYEEMCQSHRKFKTYSHHHFIILTYLLHRSHSFIAIQWLIN